MADGWRLVSKPVMDGILEPPSATYNSNLSNEEDYKDEYAFVETYKHLSVECWGAN